jgi:hypothetical protein
VRSLSLCPLTCLRVQRGDSCVYMAAQEGHVEVLKYLCEHGAKPLLMQKDAVRICLYLVSGRRCFTLTWMFRVFIILCTGVWRCENTSVRCQLLCYFMYDVKAANTYIYSYIHTYIHTYIHICVCLHYICIHTYIHTCLCVCSRSRSRSRSR